jgi:hypothetical protein
MTDPTPTSPPLAVIKRDGRTAAFDLPKIASAIARAGAATREFDAERADALAAAVAGRLANRVTGVEQIQDEVERVLLDAGHLATARAYIAYREQHARCAPTARRCVDVERSINEYLNRAGLARQRQRQPGLLAGRADPQRVGQGDGQLLAQPRLPAGSRPGAPRGRHAHPRPRHALRLLRRLVAAHAAARGPERRAGQGGGGAAASTCPAPSGRSSTSSARCRTNGPARRRSAPSTPTWRPTCARTA